MEVRIEKLSSQELTSFFPVFFSVIKDEFPGYCKKVVDYFINQAYSQANFSYWLSTGWKIVLIAKNADAKDAKKKEEIIGFSVIDKPYGGVCFCRWLGVLKEFQKQGVGKKLIEAWLNYAKEYGCHKVEIASQPEAKDFYAKCGLNLEGKRELSYFGIDQFIFGKVIGEPNDLVMTRD